MKPFQLLIKPVSYVCNLRCSYCFYLRVANEYPDDKRPRMTYNTLEKLISQFLQFRFKESIFGWQGGEPTLAGLDFFKHAVFLQQKYGESGQIIGNAIQTNGILINNEWSRFLYEYRFLVGLSLDGPKNIHDRYRKAIDGNSVWDRVMRAAETLRRNDVEFNLLCVVSKANVNRAKEIYKFYMNNGFHQLQFIPALEANQNSKKESYGINYNQYGKFLCEIFDEWKKEPHNVSIRLFNGIISHLMGYPKWYCTLEKTCGEYIVVEWNGDVYPCDFFVSNKHKIGNIFNENLNVLKKKEITTSQD